MELSQHSRDTILRALRSCEVTIDNSSHRFYVTKRYKFDEQLVKEAIKILTRRK